MYERSPKIINSDKDSFHETLFEKDDSVSIHNRTLQILVMEMYKMSKGLSPSIITELFKHRDKKHYNLKNNAEFTIPAKRIVHHGYKSTSFLGS